MQDKRSFISIFSLKPLTLALCCAFATASVCAQQALPEVEVTGEAQAASLGLEQTSTGGSRTDVSNQELPASFEQVNSETIRERGDYQVKQAIERATGITNIGTAGNGGLAFSVRGFTGVNSVGIAENGLRLGVAAGTINYPSDSWGYERIEVLRGPASIVCGDGTVGATINAVRKEPNRIRSTELLIGYGTDNTSRVGIGTTGGFGEIGSYRIDAYGHNSDGQRDLGRLRGSKIMSTLRLEPSIALRFELLADYSDQHPERYLGTPLKDGKIEKDWRDENYNASDSIIKYEDKRIRARMEWKANDWLTLKNETFHFESDRHWKNIESYVYNASTGMIDRSSYMEILHDIRQTGNRLEAAIQTDKHRGIIGFEYSKFEFFGTSNSPYTALPSSVTPTNPEHGNWHSISPTIENDLSSDADLYALYLEDAWKFHDRWLLMAGWRHDASDVSRDSQRVGTNSFSKKLHGNAWRLGLTYEVTPRISTYAQMSRGHDPVTNLLTTNLANTEFSLTKGTQYELGIKQQLPNALGEWTASVFHIKKDNILTRDPVMPSLSVQGGSQYSEGIELSAALSPWKNWRFEGNFALLKARFDELNETVGGIIFDRSGNRPSNVPDLVANLWAHYSVGAWQASLGARHVGKRYGDNANTVILPSYTVFDASLSWRYDRTTTFRLLGRNLVDKVYATASYNSNRQFLLGDGRSVELLAEIAF